MKISTIIAYSLWYTTLEINDDIKVRYVHDVHVLTIGCCCLLVSVLRVRHWD